MIRNCITIISSLLLIINAGIAPANGWGKEGHFMVCKIAERLLTNEASEAVLDLLPASAGGELASLCSWPDNIRFHYRWSWPLHYINTPELCNYKYTRDCHNSQGERGMCVAGAINNYTVQLQTYKKSQINKYNLTESLMFLAHFMGDIHQPLHVAFADDKGGNTIHVHWYHRKTNLHHVWDVSIIESAMEYFYSDSLNSMIEAIYSNISINRWSNAVADGWTPFMSPDRYASESINLACNYAYKDAENGATLEDDYFLSRLPIVETRIAQGGFRLAALLNQIFGTEIHEKKSLISEA